MAQTISSNSFMFVIWFVSSIASSNIYITKQGTAINDTYKQLDKHEQIEAITHKIQAIGSTTLVHCNSSTKCNRIWCWFYTVYHSVAHKYITTTINITTMTIKLIDAKQLWRAKTDESNQLLNQSCWLERLFCQVLSHLIVYD